MEKDVALCQGVEQLKYNRETGSSVLQWRKHEAALHYIKVGKIMWVKDNDAEGDEAYFQDTRT